MTTPDCPTFKLVVIGARGVGKTTFLSKYLTGNFREPYIPTVNHKVEFLKIHTSGGLIQFNVWDYAGDTQEYGIGTDCAILMSDHCQSSMEHLLQWMEDVSIPHKVICYNKMDIQQPNYKAGYFPRISGQFRVQNIPQYQISCKTSYNFEKPLLLLARKLLNDPDLVFVADPSLAPPNMNNQ